MKVTKRTKLIILLIFIPGYHLFTLQSKIAAKSKKETVYILQSSILYTFKAPCENISDSNIKNSTCEFNTFAGNVIMKRGKTFLYADSLIINKTQKIFYGYNNIHIKDKDSLDIYADYMHYNANTKKLLFQRNIKVYNKKQKLFTEELLVDRNKNTASYYTGGHILADSMDVYSRYAIYLIDSGYTLFKENVQVKKDSTFRLKTDSLIYLSNKKKIVFIAPTIFQQDSGIIQTQNGNYDIKNGDLHLTDKPLITRKNIIYTADTINYNKRTGQGIALRNFSFYDSTNHTSLNSHYAVFNTKTKYFKTTLHPFLIYEQKDKAHPDKKPDSIFLSADTIITYTTNLREIDSIQKADLLLQLKEDSLTELRNIIAFKNVKIYRDSLQAIADSFAYTDYDSTLTMYYSPILWNENLAQFTADTIRYFIEKKTIKYIDGKGNTISIHHHHKDLFDQVQSKNLRIFIDSNTLQKSLSTEKVQSIFYMPDEENQNKIIGANLVNSDSLWVYYIKNKPHKVKYLRNIKGTTYPIKNMDKTTKFLPAFHWMADSTIRPKNKYHIIDTGIYKNIKILSSKDFQKLYGNENTGHRLKEDTLRR